MLSGIPSQVKTLSIGFLLIFLGYGGVERFVVPFFSDQGMINAGFNSLILIYAFFTLSDPISAIFVSRYGARKCMMLGAATYFLFILSLLSNSPTIVYAASALLGIGASLLWTGQSTYLVQASSRNAYGKNSGYFSSFQSLGLGAGILTVGALISATSYEKSFLLFSVPPILGILMLSKLRDTKAEKKLDHFRLMKKSLSSKTALTISCIWFAVNFGNGLTMGILPVQIENILGTPYIGILSSLFFIIPVLLSFFVGVLSDRIGRKKMIVLSYGLLLTSFISLYFQTAPALILGVILFALNAAIIKPVSYALVGDVSTQKNLPFLTALFWTVQNLGVVLALLLSRTLGTEISQVYVVSVVAVIGSILVLSTLSGLKTSEIRARISGEIK